MKNKTKLRLKKKADNWHNIIANHIFKDHYFTRSLEDTINRIELYSNVIKKYRDYLDLEHQYLCKKYGWIHEPDTRSGEETYGYESIEKILRDLDYISDRFIAEFRLTWMLDLPNRVDRVLLKTRKL